MAKSTISVLIKRYRDRKTLENKYRSGRPKLTTEHQDRILVKTIKTAVEINGIFSKNCSVKCSVNTTKRHLRQHNLFGRRPAKKPLTLFKNCLARMKFAKNRLNWTSKE